jgi:hypothetical protein
MKSIITIQAALAVAFIVTLPAAHAQDLTYSNRIQTGDSGLVRDNKARVAMTRLEYGNSALNITNNATNNVTNAVVLDRVVVGTAGATSAVVVSDVTASATNVITTIGTTNQIVWPLGVRLSGTLRAVTTGGTPANVTVIYR